MIVDNSDIHVILANKLIIITILVDICIIIHNKYCFCVPDGAVVPGAEGNTEKGQATQLLFNTIIKSHRQHSECS